MIPQVPKIMKPKRVKASRIMKGRPVSDSEFQVMLDAIPNVVSAETVAS